MPVKKECSEGRCGLRQLLSNAAGFCRNLTGSCRVFPGYCRTGGRRVRPRRRNRDVCIQLCAIPPVKKAEFIRTVDDVSVTMLVESNMNPTSDRSGQQSGRMSRCADFRPVSESLVMDTGSRESRGRQLGDARGQRVHPVPVRECLFWWRCRFIC